MYNWSLLLQKRKDTKVRGEPTIIGMADLKHIRGIALPVNCICYATRTTPLEWWTDCFIWTASCEAVQWNE